MHVPLCVTAENVGVVGSSLLIFMFPGKPVLALEARLSCFSFPLVLKLPEHPSKHPHTGVVLQGSGSRQGLILDQLHEANLA